MILFVYIDEHSRENCKDIYPLELKPKKKRMSSNKLVNSFLALKMILT